MESGFSLFFKWNVLARGFLTVSHAQHTLTDQPLKRSNKGRTRWPSFINKRGITK